MKHGDLVNITKRYTPYRKGNKKIWKQEDCVHKDCIFLGYRNIQNGEIYYDEGSTYFVPSQYLRVMLISVNMKENPIYSPKKEDVTINPLGL